MNTVVKICFKLNQATEEEQNIHFVIIKKQGKQIIQKTARKW